MNESLILNEEYINEAMTYFLTKDNYEMVIDELNEYFNKCNNKYIKKSKSDNFRNALFKLNRTERKKKVKCSYCNKEVLNVNYKRHLKTKKHIKKYGIID